MNIRAFSPDDTKLVEIIHRNYYAGEFELPNFIDNFHCVFVITNDSGNIITAGGVRPIAECLIVTDKSFNAKERREALYKILEACMFTTDKFGYDQLHAFVQDEKWMHHLIKTGFHPTKGKALVLDC